MRMCGRWRQDASRHAGGSKVSSSYALYVGGLGVRQVTGCCKGALSPGLAQAHIILPRLLRLMYVGCGLCWSFCCCRTRLLRSLPKLDSSTAQQLTAFLGEVQQHTPAGHSSTSTPGAAAGDGAVAVSEEEQQWWQQASLAYSLLKDQAGKVQQQQDAAEQQ